MVGFYAPRTMASFWNEKFRTKVRGFKPCEISHKFFLEKKENVSKTLFLITSNFHHNENNNVYKLKKDLIINANRSDDLQDRKSKDFQYSKRRCRFMAKKRKA